MLMHYLRCWSAVTGTALDERMRVERVMQLFPAQNGTTEFSKLFRCELKQGYPAGVSISDCSGYQRMGFLKAESLRADQFIGQFRGSGVGGLFEAAQ